MNSYPLNESSLYEMKKYVSLLWCWLIVQLHIFIFKKIFNLRIIALQYCAHICHILTWIIYILKGILILIQGFPGGSDGKESTCHIGYLGSIPGLGRFPGEGKGFALQYSGLENSMDCIVHGVAKSWIRLSNFHFKEDLRVSFI